MKYQEKALADADVFKKKTLMARPLKVWEYLFFTLLTLVIECLFKWELP